MNSQEVLKLVALALAAIVVIFVISKIVKKHKESVTSVLRSFIFWAVTIGLAVVVFSFFVNIWLGVLTTIVLPFAIVMLVSFTIVKEGTAKVVTKAGGYCRTLIQQKGRTVNQATGDVIDGKERHIFGGLRWYGIWPLYKIYGYNFQWIGVAPDGAFEDHPKEWLDYILLKDDVYGCRVKDAEDNNQMPLTIELTVTAKIINPRKALFAVQNWFETMINRISPYVRDFVSNYTYQNLIQTKEKLEKKILEQLEEAGIIQLFRETYGVDIHGLEVRNIIPEPKYREATLKKFVAAKNAEARSEESSGALLQMLSQATGKSVEDIQIEIRDNPELRKKFWEMSQDLLHRRIAIDGASFLDIRVNGAKGVEQMLLNLLGAWSRMPSGTTLPRTQSSVSNDQRLAPGQSSKKDDDEEDEEEEEEEEKKEGDESIAELEHLATQ